jgi:hypothetical protein
LLGRCAEVPKLGAYLSSFNYLAVGFGIIIGAILLWTYVLGGWSVIAQ